MTDRRDISIKIPEETRFKIERNRNNPEETRLKERERNRNKLTINQRRENQKINETRNTETTIGVFKVWTISILLHM